MNAEQKVSKLLAALEPFARMDRTGRDVVSFDEVACQRGVASDLTILTSGDFRKAAQVIREVKG